MTAVRRARRTGLAALLLSICVLVAPIQPTVAAWTASQSVEAEISGATLPAPEIQSCSADGTILNLLGLLTRVSFTWTSTLPIEYQVHYLQDVRGTRTPTVTGPINGVYTYAVSYSQSDLLALLLSLLGAEMTISVRTEAGDAWHSASDDWEARKPLLGAAVCTAA